MFRWLLLVTLCACNYGDNRKIGGEEPEAECGNGIREDGEACDDGDNDSGDGCSASCETEAPGPDCGDGTVDDSEECDDGNTDSDDGCSSNCRIEMEVPDPGCGDGALDDGEDCDDGNDADGDGCAKTCRIEGCDLVFQTGCPNGQACDIHSGSQLAQSGKTICRAVTSQAQSGQLCNSSSDCDSGLTCTKKDGINYCSQFCTDDLDCPDEGQECSADIRFSSGPNLNNILCTLSCDPLASSCPGDLACRGEGLSGGQAVTDCVVAGSKLQDATCAGSDECAPGFICDLTSNGSGKTCQLYCSASSGLGCDIEHQCAELTNPFTFAGEQIGSCLPI